MQISIDTTQANDFMELASIWSNAFPDMPLTADDFQHQFRRFALAADDCLVARTGKDVAGFVIATRRRIPFVGVSPLHGHLAAIAVDSRFRGRGVGTRLVREAETHLLVNDNTTIRIGYPTYLRGTILSLLGVDIQWSSSVRFFARRGYAPARVIDSMVLDLDSRDEQSKTSSVKPREGDSDLLFTSLNVKETDFFMAFLENSFTASWHTQFKGLLAAGELCHSQVMVMKRQGRIIGFGGPFAVGPNGETCGVGLGIVPELRGRGLGLKLLAGIHDFVKRQGACRLTLFGAVDKVNYYGKAGFAPGSFWMEMRKTTR